MFIRLIYGESDIILLNPNCTAKIFIDYIKEKCKFDEAALIDLCDETGNITNIHTKQPTENIANLVVPRGTYLPVLIEKTPDDTVKNILPLLVDWDKKYPALERKLKQQTSTAEKPKKNEGKGKRHRERASEKMSTLAADTSPSRRSSTNSSELSTKSSSLNRGGRKK